MSASSKAVMRMFAPIMARFPYLDVAVIFMILGERAISDSNLPPIHPWLIYAYCAAVIASGLGMAHNWKRRQSALAYVGLTAFFGYALFASSSLQYAQWLKIRLLVRVFGVMGVFTSYSMLINPKKTHFVKRIGEAMLALYAIAYAYLFVNSPEDRRLFESLLPRGDIVLFLLVLLLSGCAMIYMGGSMFIFDAAQALAWTNIVLLLTHTGRWQYWTASRGVPFWIQMKLVTEDIVITLGLFFMSFHTVYKRVPTVDIQEAEKAKATTTGKAKGKLTPSSAADDEPIGSQQTDEVTDREKVD